jgi:hypothetical protein
MFPHELPTTQGAYWSYIRACHVDMCVSHKWRTNDDLQQANGYLEEGKRFSVPVSKSRRSGKPRYKVLVEYKLLGAKAHKIDGLHRRRCV